ncbi:antibiotic biosynthesis monooxygenase family protein [Nocardia sp. CA-107356]|uniref:antibiotic biosynthesis monooxygenase family protein n=1 Tax=Nocardia sp. CA-107356 TaxID=3239972 RepID=UPI003D8B1D4A
MTARVMVRARIRAGEEAAFEAAYAQVTAQVAGTPGHIRDELLRPCADDDHYILLSEWTDEAAFLAWEDAPIHRQTTTPMRPYWAGRVRRDIHIVAHHSTAHAPSPTNTAPPAPEGEVP